MTKHIVVCPYCQRDTVLVTGKVVYPTWPKLANKKFYLCQPCDAYVGCHPSTDRPLGTPANKPLRTLRKRTHDVFDRLWKSGEKDRGGAYIWLRDVMNLKKDECHIGRFTEEQCREALDHLAQLPQPKLSMHEINRLFAENAHKHK